MATVRRPIDHARLRRECLWWVKLLRFLLGYSLDWAKVWLAGLADCLRVPFSQVSISPVDSSPTNAENDRMNTNKHPGGRPPKPQAEKRPHNLVLRLSDDELTELVRQARAAGLSRSEFVRSKIFQNSCSAPIAMQKPGRYI